MRGIDLSLLTPAAIGELKRYLDEELETLRSKNDKKADDEDTAHLRGRIAQTKSFMNALTTRAEKFPERPKLTSIENF